MKHTKKKRKQEKKIAAILNKKCKRKQAIFYIDLFIPSPTLGGGKEVLKIKNRTGKQRKNQKRMQEKNRK